MVLARPCRLGPKLGPVSPSPGIIPGKKEMVASTGSHFITPYHPKP